MKRREAFWLAVVFLVGFLSIGIPYWSIPYGKASGPSTFLGLGLVAAALAALLASATRAARARFVAIAVGASAPAAVMLRVIVDVSRDPTSHNLWPFEIVLTWGLGLVASTAGALVGAVIARWRGGSGTP